RARERPWRRGRSRRLRSHHLARAGHARCILRDAAVAPGSERNAARLVDLPAGFALVADALQRAASRRTSAARRAVRHVAARLPQGAAQRALALAHDAVVLRSRAAVIAGSRCGAASVAGVTARRALRHVAHETRIAA